MLRTLPSVGGSRRVWVGLYAITGGVVACGSPPPTAPTTAPSPIVAESKERPIDTSPVPEPPNLVVLGRVSRPESIVSAASAWTHFPLPNSRELLRSITDDSVADVVDLSQPIDGAVTVQIGRGGVDSVYAFAVAVRGFEQAKKRLGELHRLTAGPNGQFKVEGIGKSDGQPSSRPPPSENGGQDSAGDEDEAENVGCVLAHAAPARGTDNARLVCGSSAALEALVPYLTRTMPREKWSTDVHVEVRPAPVRAPLGELRASLPILGRSLLGSASPAVRAFIDASAGELLDVVNDTQKISLDGEVAGSGLNMTARLDFQANKSVFARSMTMADRADSPPPAFFHLPEDTDTAFFGRGSDAKLFDHPRELLANLLLEATDSAGMPEAERRALRDVIADRMLTLFANGGTSVYGKGYDHAAVERVLKTRAGLRWDDTPGRAEAKKALAEQVIGWHLYQVSEPVAKVGAVLKDGSTLWNRPAFAKWVQTKSGGGAETLPRVRIAPLPVAVVMPKETVHLEISVPRDDVDDERGTAPPSPPNGVGSRGGRSNDPKAAALAKPKKVKRSPIVFHVFAVPDGSSTWLAFGLDARLVAQKAAASLASAPETGTLGRAARHEALREGLRSAGKLNGGGVATLRGLAVFTALDSRRESSPFGLLDSLPNKGATPILFSGRAEPPSAGVAAGATTGSFHLTRAVIADIVKLVMASR